MRIGEATNFQDVLGALGELLVDPDVLLEDGRGIELRLVGIADLDITGLRQRGDDLGRDRVDLPWIQSHSRGTVGSGRLTCKARGSLSLSFSDPFSDPFFDPSFDHSSTTMCTIAILLDVVPGAPLVVAANRDEIYARP